MSLSLEMMTSANWSIYFKFFIEKCKLEKSEALLIGHWNGQLPSLTGVLVWERDVIKSVKGRLEKWKWILQKLLLGPKDLRPLAQTMLHDVIFFFKWTESFS